MYKIFFFYSSEFLFFVVINQPCLREYFLLIGFSGVVSNGEAWSLVMAELGR